MRQIQALFCVAVTICLPFTTRAQLAPPEKPQQAPYCLALRGNGDAEPAHWGALANLVEREGLPVGQAGGSSATVSMFLLDNLAANPVLANIPEDVQKRRAALMIKSLYGIARYVGDRPEVDAGLISYQAFLQSRTSLLKVFASAAKGSITGDSDLNIAQYSLLANDLASAGVGSTSRYTKEFELFKGPRAIRLLSPWEARKLKFYTTDLYRAVSTVTSFDAESDASLFFRDGFIDFRKFAGSVGKVATFLSGHNYDVATLTAFSDFVNSCEAVQAGHTWQELDSIAPNCQINLYKALDAFFAQNLDWNSVNVVNQKIGTHIQTFATTAILTGSAYREALRTYQIYHRKLDRSIAEKFKVPDISDVHFGYWGDDAALTKVAQNLKQPFTDSRGRKFDYSQDVKSSMFLNLGSASWADVLSYSPAEPGLSAFQKIKVAGSDAFSGGGWSDLHPIPVLKASGCEQVIYITRKGGEAMFGQGIAKRILNLDRSWTLLATSPDDVAAKNHKLNDAGDPLDMTSFWSRMFNVANPASSYMTAVRDADAVLCTDWDSFSAENQLSEIVTESYRAPFITSSRNSQLATDLTSEGAKVISASAAALNPLDWAGCRAPSAKTTKLR